MPDVLADGKIRAVAYPFRVNTGGLHQPRGWPCRPATPEKPHRFPLSQLYLLACGRIYANQVAMTPGATPETEDGMSLAKIGRIIDAMRHERYRFRPVRRVYIPKKKGKMRPPGMPTWSEKLAAEVVRLLLEAY